ncbi:hypothetical protein HPP92_023165 [Vanilla planifolia]|uniref:Uncharacterized protein n=1 Tax=Vanilla planifolia TaxID=51239 RepID=A0A835PYX5_VANPL|nr:hypothetical protein HPP92_023165 [Vanilla planifolia]
MTEPLLDIHELFCYYNSLYFEGVQASQASGYAVIHFTLPLHLPASRLLLRYLPTSYHHLDYHKECQNPIQNLGQRDVKEAEVLIVLQDDTKMLRGEVNMNLIRLGNALISDHGPSFLALAASINSNLKIDHQRPSEGYNITTQHGFQNEVDTNGTHLFMCQSCGDSIKQSSKEPSPSDCTESQSDDKNCGNLLCEWYRHENLCSVSQANHEDRLIGLSSSTRQVRKILPQQEEVKDKRVTKRPKIMAEFLLGDAAKNLGKKASRGNKCRKRGREISLVIQLFGVYTDEESEDDPEPLVNKRSERRKRMKLNDAFGNDDSNEQNRSTPFQSYLLD